MISDEMVIDLIKWIIDNKDHFKSFKMEKELSESESEVLINITARLPFIRKDI